MATLYKSVQFKFEDGMMFRVEYPEPIDSEQIDTIGQYFNRDSRLSEILTVDTENNVVCTDLRIKDYVEIIE